MFFGAFNMGNWVPHLQVVTRNGHVDNQTSISSSFHAHIKQCNGTYVYPKGGRYCQKYILSIH